MRTDHDIDFPAPQFVKHLLLLARRPKARQQIHLDWKALHTACDRLVMLPCQDCRRHQQRALLGVAHAFEGGAQGDFRLAEAHVAAEQPVHGRLPLHIVFDLIDAAELILRLVEFEMGFKVALPFVVLGKSVPLGLHPVGVELDELLRHVLHGGAHAGLGLLPLGAAQPVQLDVGVFARPNVFGDHV